MQGPDSSEELQMGIAGQQLASQQPVASFYCWQYGCMMILWCWTCGTTTAWMCELTIASCPVAYMLAGELRKLGN